MRAGILARTHVRRCDTPSQAGPFAAQLLTLTLRLEPPLPAGAAALQLLRADVLSRLGALPASTSVSAATTSSEHRAVSHARAREREREKERIVCVRHVRGM